MNQITANSKRATQRALDELHRVGRVKIPKEHCESVAITVEQMLNRLGGETNRRFRGQTAQNIIKRAHRSLLQQSTEQQAKATATVTDQERVGNALSFAV